MMNRPTYYALPAGLDGCQDLTDLFVQRYGPEAVLLHLLMELEQYAWRCRSKGMLADDLTKMATIAQRLVEIASVHAAYIPGASPEHIPLSNGHTVNAPSDRQPESAIDWMGGKWTPAAEVAMPQQVPPESPRTTTLTILEAAAAYFHACHGHYWSPETRQLCERELTARGWVHRLGYDEHKVELARDPELAPWFPSMED